MHNAQLRAQQARLRTARGHGQPRQRCVGRAAALAPRAVLQARGRSFAADQVNVKRPIGEGAYGQVFEGLLDLGGEELERVVLKRVKRFVQGAEEMVAMEHLINVTASKAARGGVAEFMGYCEVEEHEASRSLTPGLWLVWRYEGINTLAYYLRRRDALQALARDLDVPEDLVIPVAMRQLLTSLAALHAAGLVHRDVKPHNIILSETDKRLKLIDLGACADLRSGTNYTPEESILDPLYCPPEQFVLPTDSPHLAKSFVAQAFGPVLWAQHKPDRFDTWSAGIILMCLALPSMRSSRGLGVFLQEFRWSKYDLDRWRATSRWANARDLALLDADEGAGWSLARALLRPRSIEVADSGVVSFVNKGEQLRLSAPEALKHRFLRGARQLERERGGAVTSSSDSPLSTSDPRDDDEGTLWMKLGGSRRTKLGGSPGGSAARGGTPGGGKAGGTYSGGKAAGTYSGGKAGGTYSGGRRVGSGTGAGGRAVLTPKGAPPPPDKRAAYAAAAAEKRAAAAAAAAGGARAGAGARRERQAGGLFGAAAGVLRGLRESLVDLEARISQAADETETQTTKVRQLEAKASARAARGARSFR
ncbi:putative Serine/threonine-protein kinase SNT7 [Monoraphidium neglectum]|uniref:Putative Serine/threonine-protein kinase SNT7 n=1 Tax=Monoraphidium neglectum TaxID=145388 RepID=A0A0D2JIH9_9CHLO|nr:putative Serine/threonine-protein kinase SNT7 [Monoraphidium neglectum]KIY99127.1 putative Serine/threonine-protein kinase SNT7 [Monoraphidium neglectum]|eukprot:XP_013898147.1 putative Serine/threonine-protein kinase SNT7 [Monoraphidium neglectum]